MTIKYDPKKLGLRRRGLKAYRLKSHTLKIYRSCMMAMLIGCSALSFAQNLTQSEYDQHVKQAYRQLQMSQLNLNRVLDQKKHPKLIIEKSCLYVNQLKQLEQLSLNNSALQKAKDEAQFVAGLIKDFDKSFADLRTTYQKSCTSY
ncbi:hypothetical protein [Acinetobacter lanii]|uniref:hypothetical protein n=1 Tax=Acinetobacter lanii TaxID=2715163 RepID=UPI0014900232|nr:hypothetical protein [Acinetobacter lanii]